MVTKAHATSSHGEMAGWWPSRYGPDDEAGALNEISRGKVADAAGLVRERRVMTDRRRILWTFVVTSTALFMGSLDNLVVTTALPSIRAHLHASLAGLQWTVNAYTLTFAVLLLTGATLGERFGRRRVFVAGLGLFTAGSAAAALAPGIGWLIAARAFQGVGAAILIPLTLTLLSAAVPPARRGLALGAWGAVGGLAIAIGPLVGGAVVEGASWQWIFWLNVPIGIALLPLARFRLTESYGPATRLDLPGLVLASLGLLGIVLGVVRRNDHGWTSLTVLPPIVIGVLLVAGFVAWELRAPEPMLPMQLFRSRGFTITNATSLLMFFGMFGSIFLLAQFLQTVQHYSPLQAGLRTLPWTAMLVVIAPIAGSLSDRIGGRPLLAAGLALQAAGLGWLAAISSPTVAYATLVPAFVVSGAGMPLFLAPVANVVLGSVRRDQEGIASGANNAIRELGGVFGIAVPRPGSGGAGGQTFCQQLQPHRHRDRRQQRGQLIPVRGCPHRHGYPLRPRGGAERSGEPVGIRPRFQQHQPVRGRQRGRRGRAAAGRYRNDLAHVLHENAFPGRSFRQYLTTNYHQINRRHPDAGPAGLGRNSVNWIVEQVTATQQMGTHMHGLNHLQAGDRTYNGFALCDIVEDHGTNRLGIGKLPQVVTRGLVLDVAAARGGERLRVHRRPGVHPRRRAAVQLAQHQHHLALGPGQVHSQVGQSALAAASIADFAAIVLLSLFFSSSGGSTGAKVIVLGAFAGLVAVTGLVVSGAARSMRLGQVLIRLQDTTAEIRVRFAVLLLVAFTFLAERFGLESILGAFLAGAIVGLVDRDSASHPRFRIKLEAIGYGFLVPVFFVSSGIKLDLTGLLHSPSALVRVPVFLLALLAVRGVPALLGLRANGTRLTLALGLLQATSLPFIVTATQIGVTLGKITPVTAAALVCAGLLSVLIFPTTALTLLRGGKPEPATEPAQPVPEARLM